MGGAVLSAFSTLLHLNHTSSLHWIKTSYSFQKSVLV